jgi:hypothetical protein
MPGIAALRALRSAHMPCSRASRAARRTMLARHDIGELNTVQHMRAHDWRAFILEEERRLLVAAV